MTVWILIHQNIFPQIDKNVFAAHAPFVFHLRSGNQIMSQTAEEEQEALANAIEHWTRQLKQVLLERDLNIWLVAT